MTSARQFLGLPVINNDFLNQSTTPESVFGIIETILINPKIMTVDGFLLGHTSSTEKQVYLPRQCVQETTKYNIRVCPHPNKKPAESRRILGLAAWTTHPKFLAGFVYDVYFSFDSGIIDSFVVHQLIRTWHIPLGAVEKITPKALWINNDTTIKLKITPFSHEMV